MMYPRRLVLLLSCLGLGAAATLPSGAAAPKGDPLQVRQWALTQVQAPAAWRVATGKGVLVAVVDSGVDGLHPDLRGRVRRGRDFYHNTSDAWQDRDSHGTAVAGIIAAGRNNGVGIVGVAPEATILPVKFGEFDSLLDPVPAIRWAADQRARVIIIGAATLPGGAAVYRVDGYSLHLQEAVDYAWKRGAVIVVAAGNNSEPFCAEPAARARVLCVGAVDKRALKPAYSNFDAAMATDYLVAPSGSDSPIAFDVPSVAGGVGNDEHIWTTVVPGTGTVVSQDHWEQVSGTSFAAPFVAGVAALLFQRGLTNAQVVARILSTTTDLGAPGRDPVYGYGEVNAAKAVGLTS